MQLGIDHLVIAVADPDAAAAELEARLGLQATGGGRHDALGTSNRICWLGDSYLELIGVVDAVLAGRSWIGVPTLAALERGGGLATWAVATDSIKSVVESGRQAGFEMAEPIAGERTRPDGRVVRWRLATAGPLGPGAPPFFIEHDGSAAEWTPVERRERERLVHPIGGPVRLTSLELRVPDPAAYATRLALLSEGSFAGGDGSLVARLGGQTLRLGRPAAATAGAATHSAPVIRLDVAARIEPREIEWLGCRYIIRAGRH